jgi:hypothetical protein
MWQLPQEFCCFIFGSCLEAIQNRYAGTSRLRYEAATAGGRYNLDRELRPRLESLGNTDL